jgi:hypothetical protein
MENPGKTARTGEPEGGTEIALPLNVTDTDSN